MTELLHDAPVLDDSMLDDEPIHIVPYFEGKAWQVVITPDGQRRALCGKPIEDGRQMPSEEVPDESICPRCLGAMETLGLIRP